jgi:hypothetical protein
MYNICTYNAIVVVGLASPDWRFGQILLSGRFDGELGL